MVLDHLVVQQMGKENEEGEIDNMLLHGAAALYETNEDGTAASDIKYTSQNVDELIDKVEQDAEAEVRALNERDTAVNKGEVVPEVSKPKESMSFGFAKIWEAEQNRLKEVHEEEVRPEDTVNAWQIVMENAEKERRKHLAEDLKDDQRATRRAAAVTYRTDGVLSDDGPTGKEKGRPVKGKKGKHGSDDGEFAMAAGPSDSESDSIASFNQGATPGGPENLIGNQGNAVIRGLANGKKRLSNKQRLAIETARAMEKASAIAKPSLDGEVMANGSNDTMAKNAVAGPSTSTTSKTKAPRPGETTEQRAARKAKKAEWKALRDSVKKQAWNDAKSQQQVGPGRPMSASSVPNAAPRVQPPVLSPQDASNVQAGQHVLHYMYQILREFAMVNEISTWALIALPEISLADRKTIYLRLARVVDDQLHSRGMEHYFSKQQSFAAVMQVLDNGAPVVPDTPVDGVVPPLPAESGRWNEQRVNGVSSAQQHYLKHLPNPHLSPSLPPNGITPAAARLVTSLPTQPVPLSSFAAPQADDDRSGRNLAAAVRLGKDLLENLRDTVDQQTCTFCRKAHSIRECSEIPSVADLQGFRTAILESDEPDEDKVSHRTAKLPGTCR